MQPRSNFKIYNKSFVVGQMFSLITKFYSVIWQLVLALPNATFHSI